MDAPTETASETAFGGLRVVAFESRMATETRTLIERLGGRAIIAPSMREVPLEDNHAALDFAARLLAGEFDVVIFMTGVGVRELFKVIETRHQRAAIVAALAQVVTVARGPKPVAALRNLGLTPSLTIAEPNTWREVLTGLAARVALAGKRVAVQEYGVANRELGASLEARGATVTVVPVYRWTLPEDREPLRDAIKSDRSRRRRHRALHQLEPGDERDADGGGRRRGRRSAARSRRGRDRFGRSRLFARSCAVAASLSISSPSIQNLATW